MAIEHIVTMGFGDYATDSISFIVTMGFGNYGAASTIPATGGGGTGGLPGGYGYFGPYTAKTLGLMPSPCTDDDNRRNWGRLRDLLLFKANDTEADLIDPDDIDPNTPPADPDAVTTIINNSWTYDTTDPLNPVIGGGLGLWVNGPVQIDGPLIVDNDTYFGGNIIFGAVIFVPGDIGKVRVKSTDVLDYLEDQFVDEVTATYSSANDIKVKSETTVGAGAEKIQLFIDISSITDYSVGKNQALIHESGAVKWEDIEDC